MGETSTDAKARIEAKARSEEEKVNSMLSRNKAEVDELEAKLQATAQAAAKTEVSASTIGRMMGLATAIDLSLVEGKLDLLSTKVNNLTVRMEKVLAAIQAAPTGTDLERIDVQIGALKLSIKELLANLNMGTTTGEETSNKKSTVIVEAERKSSEASTESKDKKDAQAQASK